MRNEYSAMFICGGGANRTGGREAGSPGCEDSMRNEYSAMFICGGGANRTSFNADDKHGQ